MNADHLSVRWVGEIQAKYSEAYHLRTDSDDGARLWGDGDLIIDDSAAHAPEWRTRQPVARRATHVVVTA